MGEVILFNDPHIVIKYSPRLDWIIANWRGPQTFEIVIDSLEKLLVAINRYKCERVLVDQSALTGPWINMNGWVENNFLPRLISSPCRYFAWVQSSDDSYQKGTEKVVKMDVWKLEYLIFDDVESAKAWLSEV